MRNALILENVSKQYGTGNLILDNLSHTFEPGTATGLIGPNGSGKTTLLRLLSAAALPSSGTIRYGDLNIHHRPQAYLQEVGIVHDHPALPHYLTSVELLMYVLRHRNAWDEGAEARIHALLDAVRLDERRHQVIGTYSSGMFKKTQIACALIAQPTILLMDEPLQGLDTASKDAVLNLWMEHKTNGGILLIASHLHDNLDQLCDAELALE